MAVYSVVVDALTRRVLELEVGAAQQPSGSFAWLALGSQARREMVPSSDIDSAVVWFGDAQDVDVGPGLRSLAAEVVGDLEACGMRPDPHAASASNPAFVRSVSSWQGAVRSWIDDPAQEKALILASVLVDSRPVWGVHTGTPVADTFRLVEPGSVLLRMLARFALSHRPPTGFLRGLVVEHGGEHRGRLDLKHGGVIPIVDLARWAGMAAGVTSASTIERLRAAGSAGTLPASDAQTLEDAFELIAALRMQHQIRQLRVGEPPDNYVDPAQLSDLTRSHLKEAFRAVASVQKRVAAELKAGTL
jgi:CBS domain-containing protein